MLVSVVFRVLRLSSELIASARLVLTMTFDLAERIVVAFLVPFVNMFKFL